MIPHEEDQARPTQSPWASVIVNNYNYGRFLREAVDSALAQTYHRTEVVVVDDGSTDNSRAIIASYGDQIVSVLKANGGQASTFNAGVAASRGDVVLFLDSDDVLAPAAVERAVALFDEGVSKVHWPLRVVDEQGAWTGRTKPAQVPPEGDFRAAVLERGPSNVTSPPTSGNAWSRAFLERVLPLPEDSPYYRVCGDEYLFTLAPVFGRVRTIAEPMGLYRVHGKNIYSGRTFEEQLRLELAGHEQQCQALSRVLRREGIEVDLDSWRRHSWFHRLDQAVRTLSDVIPENETVILVDDGTWGLDGHLGVRRLLPFMERDGRHWGAPPDESAALAEFERLRGLGARFLALAWASFWWKDEYPALFRHLDATYRRLVDDESIVIFNLRGVA